MYEPNCVPSVALRISLFYRDSSRWSPKRSPFTVGVCTYSGHSPSPLHYLEETNPPKAALRACGKEDPHAMSPHCGYRLHARRGGRDWRGEGGRPGSGSAACTVLHPPPHRPRLPQGMEAGAAATVGIRSVPLERRGGTAGRGAPRGPGRMGSCSSLRFVPLLPGHAHLAPRALSNQSTGREIHVCLSWEFILVCACGCFFLRPL